MDFFLYSTENMDKVKKRKFTIITSLFTILKILVLKVIKFFLIKIVTNKINNKFYIVII